MENKIKRNDITIKIIRKEIEKGKQKFPVYTAFTLKGNWFDVTFGKDVIKPNETIVAVIKGANWFTTFKRDDKKNFILNKKGEKIKKLVIMQIDDVIPFEEWNEQFKYYNEDTDI